MKILNAKEFLEKLNIGKLNIRDAKPIRRLPDELVKKYKLAFNLDTCRYDCDDAVIVEEDLVKDGKLITDFGIVKGFFDCSHNNLTSLEGCPREVNSWFDCSANQLISLEGCPAKVNGMFNCAHNNLASLEGCPVEVGGYFSCRYNKLISLEDCPVKVDGDFWCGHQNNGHNFTKDEVRSLCDVTGEIHVMQ